MDLTYTVLVGIRGMPDLVSGATGDGYERLRF